MAKKTYEELEVAYDALQAQYNGMAVDLCKAVQAINREYLRANKASDETLKARVDALNWESVAAMLIRGKMPRLACLTAAERKIVTEWQVGFADRSHAEMAAALLRLIEDQKTSEA